MSESFVYKFSVDGLNTPQQENELRKTLGLAAGVERIDINSEKKLVRIISVNHHTISDLNAAILAQNFVLRLPPDVVPTNNECTSTTVCIDGMTCRSCEITVERKWKKLPGVKRVEVNAGTGKAHLLVEGIAPSVRELQAALGDDKYRVYPGSNKKSAPAIKEKPPTIGRLIGLFALVFVVGNIFSKLGLLKTNFALGNSVSFGAVFIIGLVAASSSCIAVVGGLLLSSAAKFNERYASVKPLARMRPVFLFVIGRIIGYTIMGGLLGAVGSVLAPSSFVTAIITILTALYMLIMGLDMLHIAPQWLKGLMPRMPKNLSHRIMDAEGKEHPLAPLGLGAATFFLPCGFTQALQLYALTTHSFTTAALTLLAFALGTAPALLALGFASSSLKGKLGKFFFQFSGALVIVLGLWNIQNGLTIAGYPISFPSFAAATAETVNASTNIVMDGNTQVAKMAVDGGYQPSHFTLQAGKPVRWEVDATNASGCTTVLISRQLGIQKSLTPGKNVIEFTPKETGDIAFSCSMGMFRGNFKVVPAT